MTGLELPVRRPPLLPTFAACGFRAPPHTQFGSFSGTWHQLSRCLALSRALQSGVHAHSSSPLLPWATANTRPRHPSKSRLAGPQQQLQGGAGPGSYLRLPESRAAFFPKPTAELAPSTSFQLACSLWGRGATLRAGGEIKKLRSHRPSAGGARKGGMECGEQKSQRRRGPQASFARGSQRSKLCSWQLWE